MNSSLHDDEVSTKHINKDWTFDNSFLFANNEVIVSVVTYFAHLTKCFYHNIGQ